jgi:hypothetical protein
MTKKDYIALVKEFNLTYDADTTSAYLTNTLFVVTEQTAPVSELMIGVQKV